ncbi:MAG: hypothetical protein JW829_16750 [Pirellulales bacterium]|nr:hypothetical protein [Pirellulales bacterium]
MSPFRESVATANSALRTVLAFAVIGMVGTAGWFGYSAYNEPKKALQDKQAELDDALNALSEKNALVSQQRGTIEKLNRDIAVKDEQIARLDMALRLLKVDHRLAELRVIDQQEDSATGRLKSTIEFVEVNDEGVPLDTPRRFDIDGEMVYIEYLVAKFEDKYVEAADFQRATSICLFQRIFGEFQEPIDGYELDRVGARPTAYARGGKMSDFEQKIWDDFWNIASNPQRARELGIRAAHSEAPAIKVQPDRTYRLLLRASGGLSIQPIDSTPGAERGPDA